MLHGGIFANIGSQKEDMRKTMHRKIANKPWKINTNNTGEKTFKDIYAKRIA
jgi:hypothetical protein